MTPDHRLVPSRGRIDIDDLDDAFVGLFKGFHRRTNDFAGATGGGPEVEKLHPTMVPERDRVVGMADTNELLEKRFHLRWVAVKGRPPLLEEHDEFELVKKWFAYGAIDLNEILKERSIE